MVVRAQSGGGSVINPTYKATYVLMNNNQQNITIDITKSYILNATFLINTSADRGDVYSIVKGTMTKLHEGATVRGTAALSGTTLTVKGTDTTNYVAFALTQID